MPRKRLYKAYLTKEDEVLAEHEKEQREFNKTMMYNRENVFVCALEHGCGTSHVSSAIANYIAEVRKGKTALITNSIHNARELLSLKVDCFMPSQEENLVGVYSNVVWDGGVFGELDGIGNIAMAKAQKKIIVCQADYDYFVKLANFTQSRKDDKEFAYIFNMVAREWNGKVEDAMASYDHVFTLPIFYPKAVPELVENDFRQILGHGGA